MKITLVRIVLKLVHQQAVHAPMIAGVRCYVKLHTTVVQFGSDSECSARKRLRIGYEPESFPLNPPAAEYIHLRWMKSLKR